MTRPHLTTLGDGERHVGGHRQRAVTFGLKSADSNSGIYSSREPANKPQLVISP